MRISKFIGVNLAALFFIYGLNLNAQCVVGNCTTGEGKYVWPTGDSYEGAWKRGKQEGLGKLILTSGDYYVGSWSEGEKEGSGLIYQKTTNEFDLNYIIFGQTVISVIELDNGDLQFGYFKPGPDGKMALYDGYSFLSTGLFKIVHGVKEQLDFDFKSDRCLIGDCKSGFGGEYKIDGENRYLRVGQYLDGKWHSAGGHYNFKDGYFFMGIYAPGTPLPCIKNGGQFNYEQGVANFEDEGQVVKTISFAVQPTNVAANQSKTNLDLPPQPAPTSAGTVASVKNLTESNKSVTPPDVPASASQATEIKQSTTPPEVPTTASPETSPNTKPAEQNGLLQGAVQSYTEKKDQLNESVSSTLKKDESSTSQSQPKKKRKGAFWRTLGTVVAVAAVAYGGYELGKTLAENHKPSAEQTNFGRNTYRENNSRSEKSYLNETSGGGCNLGYQKYVCTGYEAHFIRSFSGTDTYKINVNLTNQGNHKMEINISYRYNGLFFNQSQRFTLEPGSRKTFTHQISIATNTEVKVELGNLIVKDLTEMEVERTATVSQHSEEATGGREMKAQESNENEKKLGRIVFISNVDAVLMIDGQKLATLKSWEAFKTFVSPGQIYVELIPVNTQIQPKREVMDAPAAGVQVVKQLNF